MSGASDAVVLVFAKAPIPGAVKTRLIPVLGAAAAARLHERLLENTLAVATDAALAPVELWCSPTSTHPVFEEHRRTLDISLRDQQGADLGERMSFAISQSLRTRQIALLIGTDCPDLSPDYLHSAYGALRSGHDVVVGPAEDGGYVLIGLRRPAPELFSRIEWGRDSVLEQTRKRLAGLHLRWHELPTRWDVDRPADLVRLQRTRPDLCAA